MRLGQSTYNYYCDKHLPSLAKFCGSTSSWKEDGEGGSTFLRPVWVYRKLCTRLHTWVEVRARWPRAAWSSSKKIMWQSSVGRKTNNPKLWCSFGTVSCVTNGRTPVSSISHSGTTWRCKLLLVLVVHLLRFLLSFFAAVTAALFWGGLGLNAIPLVLVRSIFWRQVFQQSVSSTVRVDSLANTKIWCSASTIPSIFPPLSFLSWQRLFYPPFWCSWWLPPWLPPKSQRARGNVTFTAPFSLQTARRIRSVHIFLFLFLVNPSHGFPSFLLNWVFSHASLQTNLYCMLRASWTTAARCLCNKLSNV